MASSTDQTGAVCGKIRFSFLFLILCVSFEIKVLYILLRINSTGIFLIFQMFRNKYIVVNEHYIEGSSLFINVYMFDRFCKFGKRISRFYMTKK